jgi:hypothetical protein
MEQYVTTCGIKFHPGIFLESIKKAIKPLRITKKKKTNAPLCRCVPTTTASWVPHR